MSRCYWLLIVAVGGCLAASLAHAQPEGDNPRADTGSAEQNAEPPPDLRPALSGIQDSIDGLSRAVEASNTNPNSTREQERAEKDLRAQSDMAFWAKWMFWVAFGSVVLTGIGVVLIWRTLVYTRDTLQEARDTAIAAKATVQVTERAANAQLRAYIGVEPMNDSGPLGNDIVGTFKIENYGNTPARNIMFWFGIHTDPHPFPATGRISVKVLPGPHGHTVVLNPREAFQQVRNKIVSEAERQQILDAKLGAYFVGRIEYVDVFGNPQHTNCCFVLRGPKGLSQGRWARTDFHNDAT